MQQRIIRPALLASLLVWLAACSTAPQPSLPSASPSLPTGHAPAARAAPASPSTLSPEASPGEGDAAVPGAPAANLPANNLLGGEMPREFQRGAASWYGPRFHKRRTASGERYDMHAFTAAHRTLPFGTLVRVRNPATGQEVDVRITDRGPFARQRVIDVSRAAAEALGMLSLGTLQVVLLVPASTPELAEAPPVRRRVRAAKRSSGPHAH